MVAEAPVYQYDGTFEGLLCCVFASYDRKEIPIDILPPDQAVTLLFPIEAIATDEEKAQRVYRSIPQKIGKEALELIQKAFLTCLPQKELAILHFLRLGYRVGPTIMNQLTEDCVDKLVKAVRFLERESHLFKGFIRFSIFAEALVAEIEPKNFVLPLLVTHFRSRYPEERFFIYDRTHQMGLIYEAYRAQILPIADFTMPEADAEEVKFRQLWQLFYETIEIKERHNPLCRRSQMPQRYWKYLTEFQSDVLPATRLLQLSSADLK
ncbi:MAG: TIGR03915 family putative DNA repair protein [Sporomusaceae bacterium]|nr:TIGR03915 family putative DNA repair protein [Sporomusaceae bacterium]